MGISRRQSLYRLDSNTAYPVSSYPLSEHKQAFTASYAVALSQRLSCIYNCRWVYDYTNAVPL